MSTKDFKVILSLIGARTIAILQSASDSYQLFNIAKATPEQ